MGMHVIVINDGFLSNTLYYTCAAYATHMYVNQIGTGLWMSDSNRFVTCSSFCLFARDVYNSQRSITPD